MTGMGRKQTLQISGMSGKRLPRKAYRGSIAVPGPIASRPRPVNVSERVTSMFDSPGTTTFTHAAAAPQFPFDASATLPSAPIAIPPGFNAR